MLYKAKSMRTPWPSHPNALDEQTLLKGSVAPTHRPSLPMAWSWDALPWLLRQSDLDGAVAMSYTDVEA